MEEQAAHKSPFKKDVLTIKTLKILITVALILTIAGAFSGCKKNNDEKRICRIISLLKTKRYITTNNGEN